MTFLPIVERELRVAARKRFTYWGRFSAAALALLIFGGMQTMSLMAPPSGGPSIGWIQFQIMKWFCFVIASLAGLFLTADTLSEEKREGTLGLLFLTDLRGYDVVLGKLISHSTQALYGLLAAFPILGLTLLIGGVSGSEFARTALVICNTLFLSLSLGLLVSSLSRDAMKALNGTLLLLLLLTVGLLLADMALARWNPMKFKPRLSLASPAYLLATTSAYLGQNWWTYLGLQHLLGWLFLILSSVCIPRAWQERATRIDGPRRTVAHRLRFGAPRARARRREKLLSKNPVLWLAARNRWLSLVVWMATLISMGLFVWRLSHHPQNGMFYFARELEGLFQGLIRLLFFLWVASQASRFFVDATRNGALELILVTPATPAQIVKGQWRSLCRIFLIPGLLLLAMSVTGDWLQLREFRKNLPPGYVVGGGGPGSYNFIEHQIIGMVAVILSYTANLFAVAWFGMWMGMTTRKPSMAVLKTICFVVVLPWLGLIFIQGLTEFILRLPQWRGQFPFWTATALVSGLSVAKDLFFIFWSRWRLANRFRQQAAQEGHVPWGRNVPPRMPPLCAVAAGAPPAVEPGVSPGGLDARIATTLETSRAGPGDRMPPPTAGGTPAATKEPPPSVSCEVK